MGSPPGLRVEGKPEFGVRRLISKNLNSRGEQMFTQERLAE